MTTDKITTRQKISAAAKNLFSTHGYSQTTIDDIITAAGVTKGAFYHYFKSKEAVCSEIIDSVQSEYQNIFESLPKESNPLEKLKAVIRQILELNSSGQWVNCRLMLRLSWTGPAPSAFGKTKTGCLLEMVHRPIPPTYNTMQGLEPDKQQTFSSAAG